VTFAKPLDPPSDHIREYVADTMMSSEDRRWAHQIADGDAPITEEIAERLAKILHTSAEFWIMMQARYDQSARECA